MELCNRRKYRCEGRSTIGYIYKRNGQEVEGNRRTSVTAVYEGHHN